MGILGRIYFYCKKLLGYAWRYAYCLLRLLRPIEKKTIVFFSHKGKQYSCNPKCISDYLLSRYPGEYRIVWAFKEPERFSHLRDQGIEVVKIESIAHLRAMSTAKVIVTNADAFVYLPRRKGQIVLDTWHGGGAYKKCGFMNPQNTRYMRQRVHFKRLYSRITLYVSSSRMFSELVIRGSRLFTGEIMEIGMPRNDILLHDHPEIAKKARDAFGIAEGERIALYAPTFRSEREDDGYPLPDFGMLREALGRRFGGTWKILFRRHHFYEEDAVTDAISATGYPDMQELLYAADVLITDYSSSIWDFSLMFKPAFLYCPDLAHYEGARDFYVPIERWPFPLARDARELEENIISFDEGEYERRVREHHAELGNCESGRATEAVCERIRGECG